MALWDTIRGFFYGSGRKTGGKPVPNPFQNLSSSTYFEALRTGPDRTTINVSQYNTVYPRGRRQLAYLGRYLYDNYAQVSYAVNTIANYSAPVYPQASTDEAEWNQEAEEYFANWCKTCDLTGRFNFDTIQRLACKTIDCEGDAGIIAVEDAGTVKLQFIEGGRIGRPQEYTVQGLNELDGVIFDAIGRPQRYIVLQNDYEYTEVDASQMKLLCDPDRYCLYRSFSPLRRGMNDIRDSQDIVGFEKKATKLGASIAAVIKGGAVETDAWNKPAGTEVTAGMSGVTEAALLGGDIPTLDPGYDFVQLDNKRPGTNAIAFLDTLAGRFVSGLDIPPAFFLDEKLTGPNQRAVNGKAQRKFEQRQAIIADLVEWVWVRVIGHAIANGLLPSYVGWERVSFQFPRKISIDAGREAAQDREDFLAGLTTRATLYGNQGKDWIVEINKSLDEDAYILHECNEVAKETGIPFDVLIQKYGFAANKATATAGEFPMSADTSEAPAESPDDEPEEAKR